jgi:long-chain acyl-CoA synthetase
MELPRSSLHEILKETVDRCASRPAYRTLLDGQGRTATVTWSEHYAKAREVARALIASGVGHGDKVCILSFSSYRWVLVDHAVQCIGACTVGIYHSLLAKDVGYIVDHSDAVLAFVQNADQLAKLRAQRASLPRVRRVVLLEGMAPKDDDWTLSFEQFLALGSTTDEAAVDARVAKVTADDAAAIVYTSGTTGVPKGAVLTHDNLTFTARSVQACGEIRPDDEALLFLPLAHVFARTCVLTALITGVTTTFARSVDTLAEDMKLARPHWFPAVPRVYEKVYSKIVGSAQAKGGLALGIFNWACRVGQEVGEHKLAKRPVPLATRARYALATRLVFSKLHAALGGRVRWCVSGAAPLNPALGRFFHAAGVLILEGLGMTENTSFTHINRVDNYRFGWVGTPGPGIEQRIAEDGEVLLRGRNVMREYYKMPAETAATISPDGWLHTGDLGEIDAQGFLRITGRKKDLIITAGGKNIAPAPIESMLERSKYIAQACVVGDRRRYLTAIVTLDAANVEEYARGAGIAFSSLAELSGEPQIVELIHREVEALNRDLASFETVKDFRIVEEFTVDNDLLTPTMKVKRQGAMQRFAALIDEMYGEGGRPSMSP